MRIKPFKTPIYVTKPLMPDPGLVGRRLGAVWKSNKLTNIGEQHRLLESRLGGFLGVNNLTLFNNGTNALMASIKALGLRNEVITTPFTFPATPHSLSWCGITPVFCDIDPTTMNLDPSRIEDCITKKTTGILGVHLFGVPCDVEAIDRIAKTYKLKVVYDAAHAFGVRYKGKGIGTFGDASMFSFHATKMFHTIEGGAVSCRSRVVKRSLGLIRNFGISKPEHIELPGFNGKMNEIQAAVGSIVLDMIKVEKSKRKDISKIYHNQLGKTDGLALPGFYHDVEPNYQYFAIRVRKKDFGLSRDELFRGLSMLNVIPSKYFYPLCSEYPHYRNLPSAKKSHLKNAFTASREIMALPFYGDLGRENAYRICEMIISMRKKCS